MTVWVLIFCIALWGCGESNGSAKRSASGSSPDFSEFKREVEAHTLAVENGPANIDWSSFDAAVAYIRTDEGRSLSHTLMDSLERAQTELARKRAELLRWEHRNALRLRELPRLLAVALLIDSARHSSGPDREELIKQANGIHSQKIPSRMDLDWLCRWRAEQLGLDPDSCASLTLRLMVAQLIFEADEAATDLRNSINMFAIDLTRSAGNADDEDIRRKIVRAANEFIEVHRLFFTVLEGSLAERREAAAALMEHIVREFPVKIYGRAHD